MDLCTMWEEVVAESKPNLFSIFQTKELGGVPLEIPSFIIDKCKEFGISVADNQIFYKGLTINLTEFFSENASQVVEDDMIGMEQSREFLRFLMSLNKVILDERVADVEEDHDHE